MTNTEYDSAYYKAFHDAVTRNPAAKISCWAMFDCHAFHKFNPIDIDDLIDSWVNFDGGRYGKPSLCPPIIMDSDGNEIRRVGNMIDSVDDSEEIEAFRQALNNDPDVSRLISSQSSPE